MPNANTTSSDFLRVLLALKENIMRDLNVADVCEVMLKNSDDSWQCRSITDNASIIAYPFQNLKLEVGDYVAVLFTNIDFRSNLVRIKSGKTSQNVDSDERHSKTNAIVLGIIYTTRDLDKNEEEEKKS